MLTLIFKNIYKIFSRMLEFIVFRMILFMTPLVYVADLIFCKNTILIKEIKYFSVKIPLLIIGIILLLISSNISFHVFLFLEIVFLFNILIIVLFQKIQIHFN